MSALHPLAWFPVPKVARQYARKLRRRYMLDRAMRQFSRLRQDAEPSLDLLSRLISGWDNEGWSARHEYITAFLRYARHADGAILECGSGLSTLLLGVLAQQDGNRVWSLEHHPFWGDRVRALLRRYEIKSVELCVADLCDYGPYSWYVPPIGRMPDGFSLVVCDGPPGQTPGGRYGLLPIMRSRLKPGCVILLDDAHRGTEREILARWSRELGVGYTICGSPKSFAMLTVPVTQ